MVKASNILLETIATKVFKTGKNKRIRISSKMIDHILCAIEHQNVSGIVSFGMHRFDISASTGMSHSEHYECVSALVEYGIYSRSDNGDIYLPLNDYSKGYKENPYVDLPEFIFSSKF